MGENRSVRGGKAPEGPSPFKLCRRGNGRFSPISCRTRRISAPNALRAACGVGHHGASRACSGPKSDSRHARNLNVDWPYSKARDAMFQATHTQEAPWTVVKSNDKMRTRLNVIRALLNRFDYGGGPHEIDAGIVGGPELVLGR